MPKLKDHIFNKRNPEFSLCGRYWFGTKPHKRLTKEPTASVCGHCLKVWNKHKAFEMRYLADKLINKIGIEAVINKLSEIV